MSKFKSKKLIAKVMTITPEEARKMRDWSEYSNTKRHPNRDKKVKRFVKKMNEGRFKPDKGVDKSKLHGVLIIFDDTGKLWEGCHRMRALSQAKEPQEFAVLLGWPSHNRVVHNKANLKLRVRALLELRKNKYKDTVIK